MKKRYLIVIFLIIFIFGCTQLEISNLNELQQQACDSAHKYNTCDKLQDIDIVSKEECCNILGKCCDSKITGDVISRPIGDPPSPFWSPRPSSAQSYINVICSGGDSYYQEWCAWLTQHPEDVPASYYSSSVTCTSNWQCTSWSSCVNNQQTRTCTDSNNCGTTTGKPVETQTCSLTTNLIVSRFDFKTILINALIDYFTHPNNAKLNRNELKDLIIVYFSNSGNTIDLSGIGTYSNEKLIDIYNKANGNTTCTPNCLNKQCGASNGCGGSCNAACTSGPLGSKTNPIPLNEPSQRIGYGYVPPGSKQDKWSHGGWVTSPPHSTLWFVIDPYEVLGKPAKAIAIGYKWSDMQPMISSAQNKATGEYTPETKRPYFETIIYDNHPYDLDKYRFLWAFVNDGDVAFEWSIWATIVPHAGVDTCTSVGEKCLPIYCNFHGGNCHESSDTCAESFCCTGTCVDPCISQGGGKCMPNPCDTYSDCGLLSKYYITKCLSDNYCCSGTCL